jgi:hypothetical protein
LDGGAEVFENDILRTLDHHGYKYEKDYIFDKAASVNEASEKL